MYRLKLHVKADFVENCYLTFDHQIVSVYMASGIPSVNSYMVVNHACSVKMNVFKM